LIFAPGQLNKHAPDLKVTRLAAAAMLILWPFNLDKEVTAFHDDVIEPSALKMPWHHELKLDAQFLSQRFVSSKLI